MSDIFRVSIIALILTITMPSQASNTSSAEQAETSLSKSLLSLAINNPSQTFLALGGLGMLYSSYKPKNTFIKTLKATGKTFIKTIASDLGFTEGEPYNPDESALKRIIYPACRLVCYGIAAKEIVFPIIEKSGILDIDGEFERERAKLKTITGSVQFGDREVSLFSLIIKGPIDEECFFTGILSRLVGPNISSILFGLLHKHSNPTIYAVLALNAGIGGFIRSRYYNHNYEKASILTPIIAHSIDNALAAMHSRVQVQSE